MMTVASFLTRRRMNPCRVGSIHDLGAHPVRRSILGPDHGRLADRAAAGTEFFPGLFTIFLFPLSLERYPHSK